MQLLIKSGYSVVPSNLTILKILNSNIINLRVLVSILHRLDDTLNNEMNSIPIATKSHNFNNSTGYTEFLVHPPLTVISL